MPVHDWTRVDAGIFQAFHHDWVTDISRALNRGILPSSHYALSEQVISGLGPDGTYAAKVKGVTIHHVNTHKVVAMVEIVSPSNKYAQSGINNFVRKVRKALGAGIHLLIVDLFPPSSCDPQGIHGVVWGENRGPDIVLPKDTLLTCVAYVGHRGADAFIELIGVGNLLPDMPLFLTPEGYVPVPLESTYQSAWEGMPAYWRSVLSTGQERMSGS